MLQIRSLSVGYTERLVLQDLSLEIVPGQVLAVVGPNGTGKSTLIRAISGVLKPRSGSIQVKGQDITAMDYRQRARYMAVVPQAHSLPANYSVYQTVLLGRTPYLSWLGQSNSADHELVRSALVQTRISALAERKIGQLSGGEQQLVLLARALAQDTPVLLLDEPTSHLDIEHQSRILSLTRQLALETNRAVLMVIHDLNLAALYADRVALLCEGKVHAFGTPCDVLTSENLAAVYHIPTVVVPHPVYGTPLVVPDGLANTPRYPVQLPVISSKQMAMQPAPRQVAQSPSFSGKREQL